MRRFSLGMLLGAVVASFSAPVMAEGEVSPEAIFRNRDKNGDGRLSVEEYVGNSTAKNARERFAKLDKDHDGFLSFQEFAAAPRFKK